MKYLFSIAALLMVLIIVATGIMYSKKYTQISHTQAVKGILFKEYLNLDAYKEVSSGLSIWGYYTDYSRSDREAEKTRILCKDYCKKD